MSSGYLLRLVAAFAAAAVLGTSVAAAADPDGSGNLDQRVSVAPVVVDGQTLFKVRGATSFPADARADAIAARIAAVAEGGSIDPASMRIAIEDGNAAIYAGRTRIVVVTEPDAQLELLTIPELAQINLTRIATAITDYRSARSPTTLTRGGLQSGAATLLFVAGIGLVIWLTRRLSRRIERDVHTRIQSVGIQSFEIVRAERLRAVVSALIRFASIVALIALATGWLIYVLDQFPWTRGIGRAMLDHVIDPLVTLARAFLHAIPNLIFLVVLYFILRTLVRMVRMFFIAVERGAVTLSEFEPEWAMPTFKIVRFGIIVLGLVVAYPYIPGADSAAFKGLSLFIGVVFSLGSSTAISNIIAGYMMTYRRVFRVGDRVKIGDIVGDVTATRLQVTHLRTPKNEEVVVPNSQIVNGHVLNYSTLAKEDHLLLHTTVGIGYETPWRQVEAMLLDAASRTQGLADTPAPFVLQTALGDFAVTYELNVACDDPHLMAQLYTALHRNILDVFNECDVAIMTPAYVADPAEPKVVPRDRWFLPPAKEDPRQGS